jgi:hypothetical protein
MENSGKAEVITLESLLSSTDTPRTTEEISASEAAETKQELDKAVKNEDPLFDDLFSTEEESKDDKVPVKEEKEKDEKEESDPILSLEPSGNSAEESESESSKLYKKALKETWGADSISTIVQIVDGEEVEVSIDDIDLDEETFKLINQAKIDELKEEAVKDKISSEGVSDFTKKLIEIDKNGGDDFE